MLNTENIYPSITLTPCPTHQKEGVTTAEMSPVFSVQAFLHCYNLAVVIWRVYHIILRVCCGRLCQNNPSLSTLLLFSPCTLSNYSVFLYFNIKLCFFMNTPCLHASLVWLDYSRCPAHLPCHCVTSYNTQAAGGALILTSVPMRIENKKYI